MGALICHAYGPIENLRVEEVATPELAPGQVLIDVMAASINFPDALMVQGLYQARRPLPFTPGAELAGTVVALGEGVTGLRFGDRVAAYTGTGAFAGQCAVDASSVRVLPESMSFDASASFVLAYGTSLHALQKIARLQPGETVLVLGAAGGVGMAAIEIAKALGARVVAAASSAGEQRRRRRVDRLHAAGLA